MFILTCDQVNAMFYKAHESADCIDWLRILVFGDKCQTYLLNCFCLRCIQVRLYKVPSSLCKTYVLTKNPAGIVTFQILTYYVLKVLSLFDNRRTKKMSLPIIIIPWWFEQEMLTLPVHLISSSLNRRGSCSSTPVPCRVLSMIFGYFSSGYTPCSVSYWCRSCAFYAQPSIILRDSVKCPVWCVSMSKNRRIRIGRAVL